jgi:hypothetical protein
VVNLLNRQGDNRIGGAARFYLTDNAFQGSNLTSELRSQGVVNTNRIEQIKDFGANVGGPIVKNKLWWWGSYGVQDIYLQPSSTSGPGPPHDLQPQARRPALSGNRFDSSTWPTRKVGWANASMAGGGPSLGPVPPGQSGLQAEDEQAVRNTFLLLGEVTIVNTGSRSRPRSTRTLASR